MGIIGYILTRNIPDRDYYRMKKNLLAEFVQDKRRTLKLTQIQLAAKSGVGLRFIRDLEQGKTSLRTDTVNKVLFLFGKCLGPADLPRG